MKKGEIYPEGAWGGRKLGDRQSQLAGLGVWLEQGQRRPQGWRTGRNEARYALVLGGSTEQAGCWASFLSGQAFCVCFKIGALPQPGMFIGGYLLDN